MSPQYPLCIITSHEHVSPQRLVCAQYSLHYHSSCIVILSNLLLWEFIYVKTLKIYNCKTKRGVEICLADVKVHRTEKKWNTVCRKHSPPSWCVDWQYILSLIDWFYGWWMGEWISRRIGDRKHLSNSVRKSLMNWQNICCFYFQSFLHSDLERPQG